METPISKILDLPDDVLEHCVQQRMGALGLTSPPDYLQYAYKHPRELAELVFRHEDIREYGQMMIAIHQNVSEGIYRSELNKGLVYVNDAFAKIFGYASREEVLQAVSGSFYAHSEDRIHLQDLLMRDGSYNSKEILFSRKDGSTFWGMISSVLTADEDTNCVWFDGVITDISQRKEIEQTLRTLNKELSDRNIDLEIQEKALAASNREMARNKEELEKALKELSDRNFELDQLVYKTTHDLRAPLSSMLGLLAIAKMEENMEERNRYLDLAENRIAKLDGFVKAMLNYAKASRAEMIPEPIDFYRMIGDCLSELEYLEQYRRMDVQLNIDMQGRLFYCDTLRMRLILSNLIANAFKYMRLGSTENRLRVDISAKGDRLEMTFADTGLGIEEQYLPKIFDMFFRGGNNSEGSGLGLYVVKQIVHQLGGKIDVESKVNRGTKFHVVLPFFTQMNTVYPPA